MVFGHGAMDIFISQLLPLARCLTITLHCHLHWTVLQNWCGISKYVGMTGVDGLHLATTQIVGGCGNTEFVVLQMWKDVPDFFATDETITSKGTWMKRILFWHETDGTGSDMYHEEIWRFLHMNCLRGTAAVWGWEVAHAETCHHMSPYVTVGH